MASSSNSSVQSWYVKLRHWEYWSFNTVYGPLLPVWLWYCLRARSFFFFNTSNPTIENGGFLNESKKDIHAMLPVNLYPKTVHFSLGTAGKEVWNQLADSGMQLPVVGKPDVGGRGRGVKILKSEEEVVRYAETCTMDFHLQELVTWPNEVGIFYARLPHEARGHITGIVRKEFLSVTGDGKHSLLELTERNERARMYRRQVEAMVPAEELKRIIPAGEKIQLSPYGNHARGATFWDDTHLASEALTDTIDALARRIPGFYFGRLDIRYRDWSSLIDGKDMVLLEVNGAGAEPTHMYDPRHSLFRAWKEIILHWNWLYRISVANQKMGHRYMSWKEGREMLRKDKMLSRKLKEIPL